MTTAPNPVYATDRGPSDACQRSTEGCCIDHLPGTEFSCEGW